MLRPVSVEGHTKIRVGQAFDGGYVMIDDFEHIAAAYSLGIAEDVSWDLDIASRGINVFQYDHTIEQLPVEHSLFRWQRVGISDLANTELRLNTISALIEENRHQSGDLILKCDVEGDEFKVLSSMQVQDLARFRQIVIEFHNLERLKEITFSEIVRRSVVNLTMSHAVVHVHANNFTRWALLGGIPLPSTLEFTLVNKIRYKIQQSDETFPGFLDMPNNWQEPDYYLGQFKFE